MHVVVGGASGFLGRHLVEALTAHDHIVTRLVRRDPAADDESRWDPASGRIDAQVIEDADVVVNASKEDAVAVVKELTGGLGADTAIEAVGVPASFEQCAELIRPGGRVANVGVHGAPASLHLEDLWIKNVTITTGLVDTYSTPTLLRLVTSRQLESAKFVTHHFALEQFMEAYDVFARAADTSALKVVLQRS